MTLCRILHDFLGVLRNLAQSFVRVYFPFSTSQFCVHRQPEETGTIIIPPRSYTWKQSHMHASRTRMRDWPQEWVYWCCNNTSQSCELAVSNTIKENGWLTFMALTPSSPSLLQETTLRQQTRTCVQCSSESDWTL